jgi:hypothetical protein
MSNTSRLFVDDERYTNIFEGKNRLFLPDRRFNTVLPIFEEYTLPFCNRRQCHFCKSMLRAYFHVRIDVRDRLDQNMKYEIKKAVYGDDIETKHYLCNPVSIMDIDKDTVDVFCYMFDKKPFDETDDMERVAIFLYLNPVIAQKVLPMENGGIYIRYLRDVVYTRGVEWFEIEYTSGINIFSHVPKREIYSIDILIDLIGRSEATKLLPLFENRPGVIENLLTSTGPPKRFEQKRIDKNYRWEMTKIQSTVMKGFYRRLDGAVEIDDCFNYSKRHNMGQKWVDYWSREILDFMDDMEGSDMGLYLEAHYEMTKDKETFAERTVEILYQKFSKHFKDEIDLISRWKQYLEILER